MLCERSLTSNVTVQLVRLQAGDAGVFHAELQVVQLLAELLDVTFFAVQLHLQLIAIRALLSPLLQIHTTSLSCWLSCRCGFLECAVMKLNTFSWGNPSLEQSCWNWFRESSDSTDIGISFVPVKTIKHELAACISLSSFWFLMAMWLNFSFSWFSSSCSLRFSFSFLRRSVVLPLFFWSNFMSFRFIISASLFTACRDMMRRQSLSKRFFSFQTCHINCLHRQKPN